MKVEGAVTPRKRGTRECRSGRGSRAARSNGGEGKGECVAQQPEQEVGE